MKATIKTFSRYDRVKKACYQYLLCLILCTTTFGIAWSQAPSHDPTKMVRAEDGRYWIFTTGQGIWAMSASNRNFSDWRPEPTPFQTGTWPGWINSYVPGFEGDFWAPGIIEMNGYYYLYYSASTFGSSRSAIGVVRTSSLSNPNWTDLGVVVSSNGSSNAINAIDPALFRDTNGDVWMSYGSWFGGIGVVRINPSTGKTTGSVTRIAGGNHQSREAPFIMKNGNYYYLFTNRGTCCNGLSSSYYIVVSRSTSITGPYSGERTFIANRVGNEHGPGHFGYGEDRLTYHYYAVNDNGAARLGITTLGWSNGWPVAGGSGGWDDGSNNGGNNGTVYQLRNRGTGLYLDGLGRTNNGDDCAQWGNTTHPNSQWQLIDVGGGYTQLRNVGTGLYLDGMGRTNNGAAVGQWANTTHVNSHWSVQQFDGNYYRIRNRNTGLYLDGMGRGANGDACGQWGNTTHPNSQWQLVSIGNGRTDDAFSDATGTGSEELSESNMAILPYPNPMEDVLHFRLGSDHEFTTAKLIDLTGKLIREKNLLSLENSMDVSDLKTGAYFLELVSPSEVKRIKLLKR